MKNHQVLVNELEQAKDRPGGIVLTLAAMIALADAVDDQLRLMNRAGGDATPVLRALHRALLGEE